jgi:hypothetical protein
MESRVFLSPASHAGEEDSLSGICQPTIHEQHPSRPKMFAFAPLSPQ